MLKFNTKCVKNEHSTLTPYVYVSHRVPCCVLCFLSYCQLLASCQSFVFSSGLVGQTQAQAAGHVHSLNFIEHQVLFTK